MGVVIITGSAGLIGAESVRFFANKGYQIVGIDNDMRKDFSEKKHQLIGKENNWRNPFRITNIIRSTFEIRNQFFPFLKNIMMISNL